MSSNEKLANGTTGYKITCLLYTSTSWLPTTFTDGVEQIKDACAAIAQADEGRGARRRVDTVFLGAKGLSTSFIPQRRVNGF